MAPIDRDAVGEGVGVCDGVIVLEKLIDGVSEGVALGVGVPVIPVGAHDSVAPEPAEL